ncbi:serine/threonine-protein kinase [Gemmatimonas sp.]|uniref:serine/threonine-protein kinase n=1 Tax=Gemmatimonas sp. TaxID=1962908 RepID=UPI0025B89070|nr:serine/threonine-protein kinase [Gemmatimonas sp.]MCA2991693.1 serine/threonine protein kinase [Gemmatimonas sp.]
MLGFANGEYYVGRSTHLRSRIMTHSVKHADLVWVCFSYLRRSASLKQALQEAEANAISAMHARLHPHGISTRGVDRVPWTPKRTPLNALVTAEEQLAWLRESAAKLEDGERPPRHDDAPIVAERFEYLASLPEWPDVQRFLSEYARCIIPKPRATEVRYWMTSCFPHEGLAVRLNVGWQTAVDLFIDHEGAAVHFYVPTGLIAAHLGIDHGHLYPELPEELRVPLDGGGSLRVQQEAIGTVKGGAKQAWLIMTVPEALRFIESTAPRMMLRQFCLGLMKQGQVPSPFSHCAAIADAMLNDRVDPSAGRIAATGFEDGEALSWDDDPKGVEPDVPIEESVPAAHKESGEPVAVIANRYRLFEKLSAGGQGEVWRGVADDGEAVAVKLIANPRRVAERGERAARFDDEAKSGRLVRGPHVVGVRDAGDVPRLPELGLAYGAHYIVMEYVSGGNLVDRYDASDEFEPEELRLLARAMVSALSCAHELEPPIVHRDVKPENILLPDGDVSIAKLTDFGISRQQGDTMLTAVGGTIGTVPYMPPEQFVSSSNVTAAADQYSLALVLWEFAMAEIPGLTETLVGTRRVRQRGIRLGTFEVEGKRRRNIERVFAKALAPEPTDRFSNVREFGDAFDAAGKKDRLWR